MKNYTKKELEGLLTEKNDEIRKLQEKIDFLESETESLRSKNDTLIMELETEKRQAEYAQKSFDTINNSTFWKVTQPARAAMDAIKDSAQVASLSGMAGKVVHSLKEHGVKYTAIKVKNRLINAPSYSRWIKKHRPDPEELEKQKKAVFDKSIVFSIIVPLYNTPEQFLKEMIESVQGQTYAGWELCLADGSDNEHQNVGSICKEYCNADNRIKYKKLEKNLGISGNTNACIEMASGDYIALFDHDDILHPSALYEMMCRICEKDADFVYTDEMVFISPNINKVKTIHFKPDYAPDNLRANNYICHFSAFKKTLLDKVGAFRSECDGSQDHDLILRLTERAERIEHIPQVLYYWRAHPKSVAMSNSAKGYAAEGGKRAVKDSAERMGLSANVVCSRAIDSIYRIAYGLKARPKVSIIIHNCNQIDSLKRCVESILEKTTYDDYEIIIADNNRKGKASPGFLESLPKANNKVKVLAIKEELESPAAVNYAAKDECTGEYVVLLNSETEIITANWIEEMLMYAQRSDIGAVGAMLYYPDDTVRNAGYILGRGGAAAPAFEGLSREDVGYMGRMCYSQNLSAVSGDCMMVSREVWNKIGGLDKAFVDGFGDIDLCMRIRKAGLLIAWTPYAELYHYGEESDDATTDKELFKSRWTEEIAAGDPYYNPSFTLDIRRRDFTIKG